MMSPREPRGSPGGLLGARLRVQQVAPGVQALRLSSRISRALGLEVTPYLVGQILVDAGFSHVGAPLLEALAGRPLAAIACTHHHEDHVGNAARLAQRHGCPVYLRNADARWVDGVGALPLYRKLVWGAPAEYLPREMPPRLEAGDRCLRAIPTPGHCVTHTALFEQASGVLFSGDLFLSGGATAIMTQERPRTLVASLRAAAALEPQLMLTGHGGVIERPAALLRRKAERIEQAIGQVEQLGRRGLGTRAIARQVFARASVRQWLMIGVSGGEMSHTNFVRAVLRDPPPAPAA